MAGRKTFIPLFIYYYRVEASDYLHNCLMKGFFIWISSYKLIKFDSLVLHWSYSANVCNGSL